MMPEVINSKICPNRPVAFVSHIQLLQRWKGRGCVEPELSGEFEGGS